MRPPEVSDATASSCRAIVEALPGSVNGQTGRPVTPATALVAAWGSPPIVLTCGTEPIGPTTLDCLGVDGVDWVAEDTTGGYVFSTFGREPAIQVSVPEQYAPEVNALVDLAPAVRRVAQERSCS